MRDEACFVLALACLSAWKTRDEACFVLAVGHALSGCPPCPLAGLVRVGIYGSEGSQVELTLNAKGDNRLVLEAGTSADANILVMALVQLVTR